MFRTFKKYMAEMADFRINYNNFKLTIEEKTDAHSAMLNMCVKSDEFRMRMAAFDNNFWT